jgi:hypothetical protein
MLSGKQKTPGSKFFSALPSPLKRGTSSIFITGMGELVSVNPIAQANSRLGNFSPKTQGRVQYYNTAPKSALNNNASSSLPDIAASDALLKDM